MKVCVFLLLLVVYGSCTKNLTMSYFRDLSKGAAAPFVNECMCQSHLNPQILDDFSKYGKIPHDPCWKCFLKCLGIKLEVLNSTGHVHVQKWADRFEHLDLSLAEKCSDFDVPDLCQKAYLMFNCVHDEYSKQYPA
ncbi:hypothetical protein ILUMI_12268 [Ignelater luminosus]|uniref:Uncharacterized protein n=1 Tax=Ignelater luminosus TaxID=2038154 RepID=A0A8K0D0M4_IGNLU|nr:hypothetical protein ILUMI_12268 [Ignelater luminosus]